MPFYTDKHYKDIIKEERFPTGSKNDGQTNNVIIPFNRTLDELIDSGSLNFTQGYAKDSDLIDGTINARFNTLTANQYNVTILSSSIMFQSGSTQFGDTADDIHTFTGTIDLNGLALGNAELMEYTSSLKSETIFSGSVQIGAGLTNYADDTAAEAGGVPIGGLYHTSGTVKVRLV